MLWPLLALAGWFERQALRRGAAAAAPALRSRRPEPARAVARDAESSAGRFHSPCAVGDAVAVPPSVRRRAVRRVGPRRRSPWQRYGPRVALAGFVVLAFLTGVLVTVGGRQRWLGQAAIAGSAGEGPDRITGADRAALARCAGAALAPLRADGMSAQRRSPAEDGPAPLVVRRGSSAAKQVTLTFDDGPNPETTPRVLAALREAGVTATFFLIGAEVERHPDLARQIGTQGHAVGSHTWHHFYLDHMDAESTRAEMEITSRLIERVTGRHPAWFRPPGGYYTPDVLATARSLDQRLLLWSQDARDWAAPGVNEIRRRVLADLHPGAVILLHDTSSQTVAALPELLREVREQGYEFVPLPRLLGADKGRRNAASTAR